MRGCPQCGMLMGFEAADDTGGPWYTCGSPEHGAVRVPIKDGEVIASFDAPDQRPFHAITNSSFAWRGDRMAVDPAGRLGGRLLAQDGGDQDA